MTLTTSNILSCKLPVKYLRVFYKADLAYQNGGPRPRASKLKDTICQILSESPHKIEGIEVVDVDNCFQPCLFPIKKDNPLARALGAAGHNIRKLIRTYLGSQWSTFSAYNIGRTEERAVPAIVVIVEPSTSINWKELMLLIKQEILRNDPSSSLTASEVEFLPGILLFEQGF